MASCGILINSNSDQVEPGDTPDRGNNPIQIRRSAIIFGFGILRGGGRRRIILDLDFSPGVGVT